MEEMSFKFVFAGPMGAGKTTAINAISDVPCVSTDVANSDLAEFDKALTTAALDYGHITLEQGLTVHLYGTPGQERFDFMWPILAMNATGVLILLNAEQPNVMQHLDTYVNAFWQNGRLPMVIGVGRLETAADPDVLFNISQKLEDGGYNPPVLAVDVRQRDEVLMLLDTLLSLIEAETLIDSLAEAN